MRAAIAPGTVTLMSSLNSCRPRPPLPVMVGLVGHTTKTHANVTARSADKVHSAVFLNSKLVIYFKYVFYVNLYFIIFLIYHYLASLSLVAARLLLEPNSPFRAIRTSPQWGY